ncbi:unnamed protein product [Sphagnum compactum]
MLRSSFTLSFLQISLSLSQSQRTSAQVLLLSCAFCASGYYCVPRKDIALLLRVFTKIGVHHTEGFCHEGKRAQG